MGCLTTSDSVPPRGAASNAQFNPARRQGTRRVRSSGSLQQRRYRQAPLALIRGRTELLANISGVQHSTGINDGAIELQFIRENHLKQRAVAIHVFLLRSSMQAQVIIERELIVPAVRRRDLLIAGASVPIERRPGKPRVA